MFVLLLKYIKPIEEVEKVLEPHRAYLEKYYSLQKFICSGRQNPRVGGVILSNAENREEVEAIIQEDPFYSKNIATYEIIEFTPTMHAEGFEQFISM
ncbi:YciI family protein [Neobacillus drentensis]|uniref:YciI family protein n=1 Tax=Neobacillus drentensis TaxID=220684 RepID=UPI002FFFC2D4